MITLRPYNTLWRQNGAWQIPHRRASDSLF